MNAEEIQEKLLFLMEKEELTQSSVARDLGISAAALNSFLKGTYKGNNEALIAKIESFLKLKKEKEQIKILKSEFVATGNAKNFFEVARHAHILHRICVVYGEAGLGKTTAAKEYATQNPDVILIEAGLDYTARVLIQELHKKCGLDGSGSIHSMSSEIVERLKGSSRLIVIDEAEHLPYRALEMIRRIYDYAGIGILLVGMPRLISNLRGKRGEYKQLYSRVALAKQLQDFTYSDCEEVVKSRLSTVAEDAVRAFYECAKNSGRHLSFLIEDAARVADINGISLTAQVVRKAAQLLII